MVGGLGGWVAEVFLWNCNSRINSDSLLFFFVVAVNVDVVRIVVRVD